MAGQARHRPGTTAVVTGDARLTYGELDQSANRLARYLTSLGAGPETLIGVCLERGAEAIRGLLAIMKTGGGYLPVDPSLPRPGWPGPARRPPAGRPDGGHADPRGLRDEIPRPRRPRRRAHGRPRRGGPRHVSRGHFAP